MRNTKRILAAAMALLLAVSLLAGCGKASNTAFQVVFAGAYTSEAEAAAYGEQLAVEAEPPVRYSAFSFGSEKADAATYSAGAMIMSVMFSAGEVNLLVCDLENAARYARSDLFYDLTEVLSQEELAEYSDRLITFEMVDEEGNPLGEQTPPYGMDLSNSDSVKRILGGDPCGIFIPLCAGDMDLAMELFWKIVNS